MTQRWYVARTTPLAEYVARDHLRTAGLEVFLPCGQTRTRRAGHHDTPLFPGYLFLRYDLETQEAAADQVRGRSGIRVMSAVGIYAD